MTAFHFIRHGEVDNPENLYYGRLPGFSLSQEGRRCIESAAEQLTKSPISLVYTSPLLRAKESAEIIGSYLGCQVKDDKRLIEIAADFEGQTVAWLEEHPPKPNQYRETMAEIYERMASFFWEKVKAHPNTHLVAVSHAAPIRLLEMGLLGQPLTGTAYGWESTASCGSDTVMTVEGDKIKIQRSSP